MSEANKQLKDVVPASLASGLVGLTVAYPFNVIRTLQQSGAVSSTSILATGKAKGLRNLFRGFSASVLLYCPATSVYYSSYYMLSQADGVEKIAQDEALRDAMCGFAGMCFGTIIWTPMDNIVQRVWVSANSPRQVCRQIMSTRPEGNSIPGRGFYRGFLATLSVWAPLSGVFFAVYESLQRKASAYPSMCPGGEPSNATVAACSVGGATVAVVLTNPLDVVRTAFQTRGPGGLVAPAGGGGLFAKSAWATGMYLLRTEGLYVVCTRGLRARLSAVVPDMAFGMFSFEAFHRMIVDRRARNEQDRVTMSNLEALRSVVTAPASSLR